MNKSCHLWDLFSAPLASVALAKSKLKQGWSLRPLSVPYGAPGGVAQYKHALAGPDGKVLRITEQSVQQLPSAPIAETLVLATEVLGLDVPFTEKDAARTAGASWVSSAKKWCILPGHEAGFEKWLPAERNLVSLV